MCKLVVITLSVSVTVAGRAGSRSNLSLLGAGAVSVGL